MPRRSLRTRSKKQHIQRLPGRSTKTHYEKERASQQHCTRCGKLLHGIPKTIPSKIRKLALSQKKIERPYASTLCHVCLQESLKKVVRSS